MPDLLATVCLAIGIDPTKQNMSNVNRPDPHRRSGREAGDGGARVTRVLAMLCALFVAAPVAADTDLLFPDGEQAARLRVDVTAGGKLPEAAWAAFLDKLFGHFDRDGDGFLSPAEAKRVFPLPQPGGTGVAMDFAALDANRDGKGTTEEFRAFYRTRGFAPVTVVSRDAAIETFQLGRVLFWHLDRDDDMKLTADELRTAPRC